MTKKNIAGLLCCFISCLASAQKIDTQQLDRYFNALEENNKFMGSVAVSQDGKIIYAKAIGFSDLENNTKANTATKYRIGSISKTFTSVLVLKAFEDKKLDLDTTIETFFPSIKNANKITIRQLLRHRSGIYNFTDDEEFKIWKTQAKTEKEMVAIIAKGGSDFEPDTQAAYSNSNYVLLTYILEKTYKKPYSELLKTYIAKPAGLKNTYFGGKINTKNNEAVSYTFADGWKLESETDSSIPLGSGGIVSTPSDLVHFSDALFTGKLLKKETLELMKTIKDTYGMGLLQLPFYEDIAYGHRGGIDKFTSVFSYSSDKKLSFALTSNGSNYNGNEIPVVVLSAVYGKPFDIPEFKTFQNNPEDLEKYVGTYASSQLPFKLTVSKEGKMLVAQASGQAPLQLEGIEKDKFAFEKAGIILEFNPAEKAMVLKQGGGEFAFVKE
ncbi:CubicO group peptidase (beta-lactamase class C family) [Flavobacterium endophyticum]|uniref:CubicO group peptidase (Beta-lactamase class C family) n=1 Tax=Flavobacterium endophyticum TaxID=1540163 RepID=A0A495M370_9FLAO|nr:serine hydrolase domain-containing protein [Flavobacterium endophyticum]RKS19053.1 CubicO group peptidase (beta-lactamase class C family) [Flavobacterium endophyticum]